jgi:hypothetical protein
LGHRYPQEHPHAGLDHSTVDEAYIIHVTIWICRWCKSAYALLLRGSANIAALAFKAPWEIYRLGVPVNSVINADRIVDTYAKLGDIGAYSTFFGLVPDYDIGISILAAGDNPRRTVPAVRASVVQTFVSLEHVPA